MYSCHSNLECYELFSGVKFSIRSFCFTYSISFSLLTSYVPILEVEDILTVCRNLAVNKVSLGLNRPDGKVLM